MPTIAGAWQTFCASDRSRTDHVCTTHSLRRWHDGIVSLSHAFGPEEDWPDQDLVALSDDFSAGLVLEAYRAGVFPMPLSHSSFAARMGWW